MGLTFLKLEDTGNMEPLDRHNKEGEAPRSLEAFVKGALPESELVEFCLPTFSGNGKTILVPSWLFGRIPRWLKIDGSGFDFDAFMPRLRAALDGVRDKISWEQGDRESGEIIKDGIYDIKIRLFDAECLAWSLRNLNNQGLPISPLERKIFHSTLLDAVEEDIQPSEPAELTMVSQVMLLLCAFSLQNSTNESEEKLLIESRLIEPSLTFLDSTLELCKGGREPSVRERICIGLERAAELFPEFRSEFLRTSANINNIMTKRVSIDAYRCERYDFLGDPLKALTMDRVLDLTTKKVAELLEAPLRRVRWLSSLNLADDIAPSTEAERDLWSRPLEAAVELANTKPIFTLSGFRSWQTEAPDLDCPGQEFWLKMVQRLSETRPQSSWYVHDLQQIAGPLFSHLLKQQHSDDYSQSFKIHAALAELLLAKRALSSDTFLHGIGIEGCKDTEVLTNIAFLVKLQNLFVDCRIEPRFFKNTGSLSSASREDCDLLGNIMATANVSSGANILCWHSGLFQDMTSGFSERTLEWNKLANSCLHFEGYPDNPVHNMKGRIRLDCILASEATKLAGGKLKWGEDLSVGVPFPTARIGSVVGKFGNQKNIDLAGMQANLGPNPSFFMRFPESFPIPSGANPWLDLLIVSKHQKDPPDEGTPLHAKNPTGGALVT